MDEQWPIFTLGFITFFDKLPALLWAQHGQVANPALGIIHRSLEQPLKVRGQPRDRRFVKQVCIVMPVDPSAFSGLAYSYNQLKLGRRSVCWHALQFELR